jgi:hypothetical protein
VNKVAKKEYIVLVCLALVLLATTLPALQYARREKRDGMRRDALVAMKRKLEEANNKLGYYPANFSAAPDTFVATSTKGKEALGWYLEVKLENNNRPTSGFDYEGDHNFYYRIQKRPDGTYYQICGGTNTCGVKPVDGSQ